MGYSGSLGGIDLASALQVFGPAGRSGLITITQDDESALIVLECGQILFAACDAVGRIGETFVQKGYVDETELQSVLHVQRSSRRQLLGQLLVSMNLVPAAVVSNEIEAHIVKVLAHALAWSAPTIHFDEAQGEVNEIVPPYRGDMATLLLQVVQA